MPRLQCNQRQLKSTGTLTDRCRTRIEECLRTTPHGAERLARRNEVINEALAEKVRRGEQRKKRSDRATVAVPETESAAPEPREHPIEPEANPKRILLMKSASLTTSGSGQQRQKRSIPDDESGMQVEDTPETGTGEGTASLAAPSATTRRRVAVKSEPVAVTTPEAIDWHCEKTMRIASVDQIELGNIMELSLTGQVLRWARRSNLSGVSLCKADGWNLKNHSLLTVARHLREKTHPSMLVVTIREGEETRDVQCGAGGVVESWSKTRLKNEAWRIIVSNRGVNSLEKRQV